MYDRSLFFELILEIEEAIRRIERRFKTIQKADDFIKIFTRSYFLKSQRLKVKSG